LSSGAAAKQGSDAVVDQPAHDQRAVGALHVRDRKDLPRNSVEIVGVGGDHVYQHVDRARNALDFNYFGDACRGFGNLVEHALGHLGGDETR